MTKTFFNLCDLGISFDRKRKFYRYQSQIINIINRSNKVLGFININCADITENYALKPLYYSLMRFIRGYDSSIWFPSQSDLYRNCIIFYKLQKIRKKKPLTFPFI